MLRYSFANLFATISMMADKNHHEKVIFVELFGTHIRLLIRDGGGARFSPTRKEALSR